MKIAIWGFSVYGQEMYNFLQTVFEDFQIVQVFDRNFSCIDFIYTEEMEIISPELIQDHYEKGYFDAVFAAMRPAVRPAIERQLKELHIPVITLENIADALKSAVMKQSGKSSLQLHLKEDYQKRLIRIHSRLQDEESHALFWGRVLMAISGESDYFLNVIRDFQGERQFFAYELKQPMNQNESEEVILFGGGEIGKYNKLVLDVCNIPIAAVCSLDDSGVYEGWTKDSDMNVVRPNDILKKEYEKCLIIISSDKERQKIYKKLEELGIPDYRIYDPSLHGQPFLIAHRYGQYFDIWSPKEKEIFVDCGAYDGRTTLDFLDWCNNRYGGIYALEPIPEMAERIRLLKDEKQIENLHILPFAAWDKQETISFYLEQDLSGSRVDVDNDTQKNGIIVQGMPLDKIIDQPVSFLKMDIEGSEWQALNGAEQIIRRWRPKLAISIYHKKLDVLVLTDRILQMVPEYRLYIRQYDAGLYETVLYATV